MSWSSFHCENPDFLVRSVPDSVIFKVSRAAMYRSEVFRDMFDCCETSQKPAAPDAKDDQAVDLHETAAILTVLLRLLHSPPAPPVPEPTTNEEAPLSSQIPRRHYDPATIIPLPLLVSLLYGLVDKYALSSSITKALDVHLMAHALIYPLTVYGFATLHGMDTVASEASQFVMPLASYRSDEVKIIPTVEAYHKIVRLQDLRVKALRELVLGEDIFPHGYGACTSHCQDTTARWNRKREALAMRVETVTDVAGEMDTLADTLPQGCKMCHKACTAAVKMLAYKFRKALRRIDQLPLES